MRAKTIYSVSTTQNLWLFSVHVTATGLLPPPSLAVPAVEVLVLLDIAGLQSDTEEMQPELTFVALHPGNLRRKNISSDRTVSVNGLSSYLLPCGSLTLRTGWTVVFRVTGWLLRLPSFLFLLFPDKREIIIIAIWCWFLYWTHFNLFFSLSSTELSEICCFFLILSFLLSSLAASSSASSCSNSGYFFSRLSGVAWREGQRWGHSEDSQLSTPNNISYL